MPTTLHSSLPPQLGKRDSQPVLHLQIRCPEADRRTDCLLPRFSEPSPAVVVQMDVLLDTYFSRFHTKPFHILDESSVRQRLQLNQLPSYLIHAIYAVAAR